MRPSLAQRRRDLHTLITDRTRARNSIGKVRLATALACRRTRDWCHHGSEGET